MRSLFLLHRIPGRHQVRCVIHQHLSRSHDTFSQQNDAGAGGKIRPQSVVFIPLLEDIFEKAPEECGSFCTGSRTLRRQCRAGTVGEKLPANRPLHVRYC